MAAAPPLDAGQPQRQRLREPELVGHSRQQRAARVRHQARSVRRDFYSYQASITHSPPRAARPGRGDPDRRIANELPSGIDDRPTVTPPVAGLAVDPDQPTRLRVVEPL